MSIPAPYPRDEAERQFALHELGVLDTPPEERFDRITKLAARIFNADASIISLVDEERQWFKSAMGRDGRPLDIERETPREDAFCAYTILSDDIFYVRDATADPRFADNPLVTEGPQSRSYAGAPLVDSRGNRLGAFCVSYKTATDLDPDQLQNLFDFAALTIEQLELARDLKFIAKRCARAQRERDERNANLQVMLAAFQRESEHLNAEIKKLAADPEEFSVVDAMDRADESARRTSELVDQIVLMSQIAGHDIIPEDGVFSVNDCAQHAIKAALTNRERGGVCVEIPTGFTRDFIGDGALVERALTIAMGTMIDATGGDEIRLRVSSCADGEDLQLELSGDGVDAASFECGGDRWIPAQTVRRICELFGGGVDVRATPDGAGLWLRLPVMNAPARQQDSRAAAAV